MSKKEAYDHHAAEYDVWFDKNEFIYKSELLAVRNLLPTSVNKNPKHHSSLGAKLSILEPGDLQGY
jgi:hypothetical protein